MNDGGAPLRLLPYGDRALLVELAGLPQTLRLYRRLSAAPPRGVVELVPAARTVLVRFDPAVTGVERLHAAVRAAATAEPAGGAEAAVAPEAGGAEPLVVPVRYDGVDLPWVARRCGLSEAEVVARHTAGRYQVAFCGFAPGFGYLTGLEPALRVPRHATPRPRVAAGSVAIAEEWCAVYPAASPGGWRILGHTDVPMWRPERQPPTPMAPGVPVRFRSVG